MWKNLDSHERNLRSEGAIHEIYLSSLVETYLTWFILSIMFLFLFLVKKILQDADEYDKGDNLPFEGGY